MDSALSKQRTSTYMYIRYIRHTGVAVSAVFSGLRSINDGEFTPYQEAKVQR